MAAGRGKPYGLYAVDDPASTSDPRTFMPSVCRNKVSELFFSERNIAALQQGIRYGVYRESSGELVIGNQSRDELETIMRGIYLSDGINLPINEVEQVRALNSKVLDFAVPRVVNEARMYVKYRRDSTSQLVPQRNPLYTSGAGLRGSGEQRQLFSSPFR